LIDSKAEGALDATGYEARHVSVHYRNKRPNTKEFLTPAFPKLTVLCHIASYLWLAAQVSQGPGNDAPDFAPTLLDGSLRVDWDRILADKAYDSEPHHELVRALGIRSFVAPINSRGSRKWPKTRYRRQLKRRFPKNVYHGRVHVEGAFSQDKRQLGSALRARSDDARAQELFLRVLVHDLAILKRVA
jgi:transposase